MFQDEHHPPRLNDFPCMWFTTEGSPHLTDISYLNPVCRSPVLWENGSVVVILINLCLESCVVIKWVLTQNCQTKKKTKQKPHAFLSYKIGQLLPYFPPRTNLGFLFTDYVFRKIQYKKKKPRICCCFYLIFIAVIILMQF